MCGRGYAFILILAGCGPWAISDDAGSLDAGDAGHLILISEPLGPECVGISNHDGVLILNGSCFITDQDTLQRFGLAHIVRVDGTLSFSDLAINRLVLTDLVEVSAALAIQRITSLNDIELTTLRKTGSLRVAANTDLETVVAPLLAEAPAGVVIEGNHGLGAIDLPSLETTSTLRVSEADTLSTISLSVLAACDNLEIYGTGSVALNAPQLSIVRTNLRINGWQSEVLMLPSIGSIGETFEMWSTTIGDLSLPNLTSIGMSFREYDNPMLSRCDVAAVLENLTASGGLPSQEFSSEALDGGVDSGCL